jgi:hypothetical protein
MPAGGHVAAIRIDCPCGESFMKDGNNPIKCPKEKRIEELEKIMNKFCDRLDNMDPKGTSLMFDCVADIYRETKQLIEKENDG